jgi:hypothetical protein
VNRVVSLLLCQQCRRRSRAHKQLIFVGAAENEGQSRVKQSLFFYFRPEIAQAAFEMAAEVNVIPLLAATKLAFPGEGAARGPRCPENEGDDQKRSEERTGGQSGNG